MSTIDSKCQHRQSGVLHLIRVRVRARLPPLNCNVHRTGRCAMWEKRRGAARDAWCSRTAPRPGDERHWWQLDQTEVVGRGRPSLPDPAVPPDVVGRGMWCRAPVALPVTDDERQMGGISNSMAVAGRKGSPVAGRLLLTACHEQSPHHAWSLLTIQRMHVTLFLACVLAGPAVDHRRAPNEATDLQTLYEHTWYRLHQPNWVNLSAVCIGR